MGEMVSSDAAYRPGVDDSGGAVYSGVGVEESVEATLNTVLSELEVLVARMVLDFDANTEVARARDVYARQIDRAERLLRRLERAGPSSARDQLRCMAAIVDFKERDLTLTFRIGLLSTVAVRAAGGLDDANAIRERLNKAGVFDQEELVSDGEREWLGLPPRASGER